MPYYRWIERACLFEYVSCCDSESECGDSLDYGEIAKKLYTGSAVIILPPYSLQRMLRYFKIAAPMFRAPLIALFC